MKETYLPPDGEAVPVKPPFLYEIRVKSRLSAEQWTSWFDDLALTTARGETLLRGRVPDHAALYALLSRLRDLAVPLVSVRVIDADAQVRMARQNRRYDLLMNGLMVLLYLLLLGGLTTITVLVAPVTNVALLLALLGAALGALAHAFGLWSGRREWRWVAYSMFAGSAVAFVVFIPLSGLLPPALGIALLLFVLAGGLYYLITWLRRWQQERAGMGIGPNPLTPFPKGEGGTGRPGSSAREVRNGGPGVAAGEGGTGDPGSSGREVDTDRPDWPAPVERTGETASPLSPSRSERGQS